MSKFDKFNLKNLFKNIDETKDSPDQNKVEMEISNSADFGRILSVYDQGGEYQPESCIKAMNIFINRLRQECRDSIREKIGNPSYPLADESIPSELNQGIVRSEDHKSREVINRFINEKRYGEAKDLIINTIRNSSYEGRLSKLENKVLAAGLNIEEI